MERLPSLFVSHGAPTFALEPGLAGAQLNAMGRALPRPKAVLVVSPHWTTREAEVTGAALPRTIHDFGGFDPALYDMSYPADGHPALAARAAELLRGAGWAASVNPGRGLDHGAWVPLMHLYPDHDVPVIQVSMPSRLDARLAFQYGRALGPLGKEGVLVVGSGSLTHNLFEFRQGSEAHAEYAGAFTAWIREAVQAGDEDRLIAALESAPHAARAHPTTEHFLPLLIALGAAPSVLPATIAAGGIVHGVLSMESYVFGAKVQLNLERNRCSKVHESSGLGAMTRGDMTGITRIAIGELHTQVGVDVGPSHAIDVELGIGLAQLGRGPFRHQPPSELELESAIAFVEDAVMPLARVLPPSTKLVTSDAIASRLLTLAQGAREQRTGVLTLQQVEHVFGELAAVSLGRPSSSSGVPTDGPFVSCVLILREFMHHLAFGEISIEQAATEVR